MELKHFFYDIPRSLIAAYPSGKRQESRLLVLQRKTGEIIHSVFSEVKNFLDPGDLLVLNDTKVFPARLNGTKESGGKVEVLLLERFPHRRSFWIALIDAAKKPRVGSQIHFGESVSAHVMGDMGRGRFGLEFHHPGEFSTQLEELDEPPLPPYVRHQRNAAALDRERYQTVYAAHLGAIAARRAASIEPCQFLSPAAHRITCR